MNDLVVIISSMIDGDSVIISNMSYIIINLSMLIVYRLFSYIFPLVGLYKRTKIGIISIIQNVSSIVI